MRENNLKQYLLGLLPEPERTQLELQLLSDDNAYQQFLLAEDDLIEAYLQQELSLPEQERFDRLFLAHPERQQKLRLTRALLAQAQAVANTEMPKAVLPGVLSGWAKLWPLSWKLAATAAALLLVAVGLRAFWSVAIPEGGPTFAGSPPTSATAKVTQTPVVGTKILPVELSSGQSMAIGTTLQTITITPEVGHVQLQLWLRKDQWDTYKISLQPYDLPAQELPGEFTRQQRKGLSYLTVALPVAALPEHEFILKLEGVTATGERAGADHYNFKVKRH